MKKGQKLLAILLAGATALSVAGCGAKVMEEVEKDKTQLYVGTYAGGIGDKWLQDAIDRFEKKYADTSFEKGKKGVQVIISENNKTSMGGVDLIETIETTGTEVFFTESVFYYEWVQKNKFYEITDIVNDKLTEFGEEESIADKLDEDLLNALTVDGKVYALPFWMASYGITYNATLFDQKGWFFAENGSFTNTSGKLSAGPDGKSGTYDDGMPATYDEFFKLLDQINKDNVTPIQYAGAAWDYMNWLGGCLFADYEGYEDLMLNYTFDGTDTLVKTETINEETGTYETEEVQITQKNGYELARQEGLLKVSQFMEKLLRGSGTYYDYNSAVSGSYKQHDVQIDFVRNTSVSGKKPVAMILEGSWWENEASLAFESTYGTGATKYDSEYEYKYMPLPKADVTKVGSENLWVSPLESYGFIGPNISESKVEVAKKFLQFCHTDESMTAFTSITGILKPYEYKIDDSTLTPYSKSVVEAVENSRVVFPKSDNSLYRYAPQSFWISALAAARLEESKALSNWAIPFNEKEMGLNTYKYSYLDWFKGITKNRLRLWESFESVLE